MGPSEGSGPAKFGPAASGIDPDPYCKFDSLALAARLAVALPAMTLASALESHCEGEGDEDKECDKELYAFEGETLKDEHLYDQDFPAAAPHLKSHLSPLCPIF